MATPARATTADLADLGVAGQRFANVTEAKKQKALNAASDLLDSYLSSQFDLPLTVVTQDVIACECGIAAYTLLLNVGFNPMSPADQAIKEQYERWMAWAESISKGELTPLIVDSSGGESVTGPEVITASSRGYSERGFSNISPPVIQTDPFSDN